MANCTCDGEHYECMGCDKMICYEMTDGGCGICLHCIRCGDCGCDCDTLVIDENLEQLNDNDVTIANIVNWYEQIDTFKETLMVHYSYKNDLSDNRWGLLRAWGNTGITVLNVGTRNIHRIRIHKVHSVRKIKWHELPYW